MRPVRRCCPLSVLTTSLPAGFVDAVREIAAMRFTHVDVVGAIERPAADVEALAESGLQVACGAIGKGLPAEHSLDAPAVDVRRAAVEAMQRQIADVGRLGATHCYVVPATDSSAAGLARFADACARLADFAGQRMMRLCVEHCPGRALPTVVATLDWLDQVGHPNLSLLLDIGHCLISKENPAEAMRKARRRLGYVHLDDNDGMADRHWPLLTGSLTEELLRSGLQALREIGYQDALALEYNGSNPEPQGALRQGKLLVEGFLAETDDANA